MEGKLKKTGNQFILYSDKKEVLAITEGSKEGRMLSLKNCQTIERGYDLDELAYDYSWNHQSDPNWGGTIDIFKDGFQKALELLGDKKFSEEDMIKCFNASMDDGWVRADFYLQSFQQTEWDVEIVTEPYVKYINRSVYPPLGIQNKLDTEGNLILKRK